jgi:hypothetical protein
MGESRLPINKVRKSGKWCCTMFVIVVLSKNNKLHIADASKNNRAKQSMQEKTYTFSPVSGCLLK